MNDFPTAGFTRKKPKAVPFNTTDALIERGGFHTVCLEAECPNIGECFTQRYAMFMILGKRCTRHCTFCGIETGMPMTPEEDEPKRLADTVRAMALRHVVITSPARDDLPDGGAGQFARTVEAVKAYDPDVIVELLIPDMLEDEKALATAAACGADIIGHNLETVPRLYAMREGARYERSLRVLRKLKELNPAVQTKSGIMVGMGESIEEVLGVMHDLIDAGCEMMSIGQYVPPSNVRQAVAEYIEPSTFDFFQREGRMMGFERIVCSPYTRRSHIAAG